MEWLKRIFRFQRNRGGKIEIDYILILSIILFTFNNLIDQIIKGQNIVDRIEYTLPILVLILPILIFKKNKYFQAIVFLLIAIPTALFETNVSGYSASIFFIFSFHLIKNKTYGLSLILISISSITGRSIIKHDTIPGAVTMITIFLVVYAIYYFLIYKSIEQPTKNKLSGLTKQENELLQKMCDGKPQGVAGSEIGHTNKQETSKMMSRIRDKLYIDESQSNDKVIYLFTKHGK